MKLPDPNMPIGNLACQEVERLLAEFPSAGLIEVDLKYIYTNDHTGAAQKRALGVQIVVGHYIPEAEPDVIQETYAMHDKASAVVQLQGFVSRFIADRGTNSKIERPSDAEIVSLHKKGIKDA